MRDIEEEHVMRVIHERDLRISKKERENIKTKKFKSFLAQALGGRRLKSMSFDLDRLEVFDFYGYFKAFGSISYCKKKMDKRWGPYFTEAVMACKEFVIAVEWPLYEQYPSYTIYSRSEKRIMDFYLSLLGWMNENSVFRGQQFSYPSLDRPKISRKSYINSAQKDLLEANTIHLFKNLKGMRRHGLKTKRGIILYGNPGNGKTSICRSISNSLEGITRIWLTGWDISGKHITEIFEIARELSPSIIFLEDLDTAGISRNLTGRINPLLGRLLNEMDGIQENDGIVVIATTNNIWALDEALANRPGRFDLKIKIGNPHPHIVRKITGHAANITLAEAFRRREEKIFYEKVLGRKYEPPSRRERVDYIG